MKGLCKKLKRSLFIALVCLFAHGAWAQRPGRTETTTPPAGVGGTPATGSDQEQAGQSRAQDRYDDRDTFGVFEFNAVNPLLEKPYSDSLLGNYFQQYDPTRHRDLDWMQLGILGSAHQPLAYQPQRRQGFDVGLHQYELYYTQAKDLHFYRLQKAYTNLSYTQGAEQADGYATAQFSRNFAKGLNYTLDYKRINQLGSTAQYPNQNNRHTAFATGLWWHSAKGRYDGFLAYAANTTDHEDNGGLETEPERGGEFNSASSADVFLDNARTRHARREWSYTQHYRVGGDVDSTGRQRRAYTLAHQFTYENSAYKYHDTYSIADTSFYNRFPSLLNDERGVRYFLRHQRVENAFRISTFKLSASDKQNKARSQKDLFEVGLRQAYHRLRQEPGDTVINNLFLEGKAGFRPSERLDLQAEAQLGLLWGNAGDYRVSGVLFFDAGKLGRLSANLSNQLYSPTLMQSELLLNQRPVWDKDFKKTLETNLSVTYALPAWKFEVTGGYHLLNNLIYFDSLATPQQTGVPVSILQLVVKKDFRVWRLHLDNVLALQQASEDVVRLPQLFGKHSFYYAGLWFKVLDVRLGVDLRYTTDYYANYYNPVIGQFQLQDRFNVPLYPALDAYFSMRVTKLRAFIKWENFSSTFITDRLFYLSPYYAQPSAGIRWGIKWRLVN